MAITPTPTPPAPIAYTVQDIVRNAMIEAGWLGPGEEVQQEEGGFVFSKLNDMLDEWAAQHTYAYAEHFEDFNLVIGKLPQLIGPGPDSDFVVPERPVRIISATIILNQNGVQVECPCEVRDADWWAAQQIKDLESQIPSSVYYQPDWPNGSLFFWPVPDAQYQTKLQWWAMVRQFRTITESFSFPPAYRRALTLSLAEELAGPRSLDPKLTRAAANARAAVRGNNAPSPRINTGGAGMPKPSARPRFNFLTGQPW